MKQLTKGKQFIADMKRCRGIEFPRIGMAVEVAGKRGKIVGMNSSANLDVKFPGLRGKSNCHPFWETRYFDRNDNVIANYRKDAAQVVPDNEPAQAAVIEH